MVLAKMIFIKKMYQNKKLDINDDIKNFNDIEIFMSVGYPVGTPENYCTKIEILENKIEITIFYKENNLEFTTVYPTQNLIYTYEPLVDENSKLSEKEIMDIKKILNIKV
jgi:hypothetical protein